MSILNYIVNDFLDMSNEDILKENGEKKFDIILANPPWGQSIHYEFTQKFLDLANQVISIMPNSIVKRDSKHFKKFKDAYNDKLYDVEEVDSKLFEGTNMQNCCIFCFKDHIDGLHIKYLDGKEENLKCINEKDYSGFTPYEKEIVKYLYNEKPNIVQGGVLHDERGHGITPKKHLDKYINWVLNHLPDDKVYLIVQAAAAVPQAGKGRFDHNYISNKVGQILNNKNELSEYLKKRGGVICHYMYFNTIEEAENCKFAMQRPLLRFPLLRLHTDRHLNPGKHYKYIPDIDWSNIKSDYDILKACKCPENKIDEYLNYVNNIIRKSDKENEKQFK